MKILHVAPVITGYSDGPSRSVLGLAKGQAGLGHKVGLLPSEPPGIQRDKVPGNIVLLPFPERKHLNPFWVPDRWMDLIRDEFGDPDIVHFHDFYIPFQFALARYFITERWPYIASPRGSIMSLAQRKKFLKKSIANTLFARFFLKKAAAVHALCKEEADELKKFMPGKKIIVSPNGVDDSLFSLSGDKTFVDEKNVTCMDDLALVYVGRIDVFTKGIDLLLGAIKKLQDDGSGDDVRLIIVGPFYTEADKQEVENAVKSLRDPSRILFTGPLYGEDKWKLLRFADAVILASRHEGMPNTVLEAMALKKPCVVTPGTNMQEIISNCNGGWLAGASVDSIAEVILEVKKNKDQLISRGVNACKYVKENLTWRVIAEKHLDEMNNILDSG